MSDTSIILIGLLTVLVWLFVTVNLGLIDQRISGKKTPTVGECLKDGMIVEAGIVVLGSLLFILIAGLWALGKFVLSFWVR